MGSSRSHLVGWVVVAAMVTELVLDWELYPRRHIVPGAPWLQQTTLLLAAALAAITIKWPRSPQRYVLLIGWSLLGLFAGVRLFLPGVHDVIAGARMWLALFVPSTVILYLAAVDSAPYRSIPRVAVTLVTLGTILSVAGITIFLTGSITPVGTGAIQTVSVGPFRVGQILTGIPYRISAFTGNANSLAFMLFVSILLTVALAKTSRLSPVVTTGALAIQGAALFLTYSRSGLALTLVGASLVGSLSEDGEFSWKRFIAGTALLGALVLGLTVWAVAFWFGGDVVMEYGGAMMARLELGFATRMAAWEAAASAFLDHPFIGIGLGNAPEFLEAMGVELEHAHNVVLNVAAELGLIGVLGLTAVVAIVLRGIVLTGRRLSAGPGRLWYLTVAVIVLGVLVRDIAEATLLRVDIFTFLWIYLAGWLLTAGWYPQGKREGGGAGFDRRRDGTGEAAR